MTPPKLTPLPIDDQARSGIPVVAFTEPGRPVGPMYFSNGWRWMNGGLYGTQTNITGYLPLSVPIMGPPPRDDKWRMCWFKDDDKYGPMAMRWYEAILAYGDEIFGNFFADSEILAHLPWVPAPEAPAEPEPPAEPTLKTASINDLLAELAVRYAEGERSK